MTSFELPMPPTENNLHFNKPGKGRSCTKEYWAWRKEAGWQLKIQRVRPVPTPTHLSILVEFTHGKSDVANRIKAVQDLLVTHKIIPDDNDEIVTRTSAAPSRTVKGVLVMLTPAKEAEAA